MTLTDLGTLCSYLVGGITTMAEGLGSGVVTLVKSFMFETSSSGTQSLSAFILTVAGFGGVALAVGIGRRIFNWLISLGGRK